MTHFSKSLLMSSLTLFAVTVQAEEAAPAYQPALTWKAGGWYGVAGGEEFESESAGTQHIEAGIGIDGEAAWGLTGFSGYFSAMSNLGSKPGVKAGAMQGLDNVEVGKNAATLYQFWVQQNFQDDAFSVLFGLYDLNTEFYVTEPAGLLLNPSFGIGAEAAGSGASLFPVTGLALRGRWQINEHFYAQFAALDAVVGDVPDHPERASFKWDSDDGALLFGESGYSWGLEHGDNYGKLALGLWRNTEPSAELTGTDESENYGWYVLVQHPLMSSPNDPEKGLSIFGRLGFANSDVSEVDRSLQLGAQWQAPFSGWEQGTLAFGVTYAGLSEDAGDESEATYEITYHHQCTDHFAAQVDLQQITQSVDGYDDATALGVRLQYDL